MKNLTIKKVALGVMLAGYAASGAFALSATSNKTIIGRAPTIEAPSSATLKFDYVVMRNVSGTPTDISGIGAAGSTDRKAQVGDVIHIKIKYDDLDGDAAANLLTTTKQDASGDDVKFVVFNYDGSTPGADVSPTATTAVALGTNGEYTYTITSSDVGKTIGINLTPVSEFGDPDIGTRIKDNNLFAASAGGGGTTPGGGGTIVPGVSGKYAYIFHSSDIATNASGKATPANAALPLASTAAGVKTPTLGQKYVVTVYDGSSATDAYASSNTVEATNQAATTIKWYVNGGNAPADATSTAIASGTDYVVQTNPGSTAGANEFTIPATNSAGLALITSAPAAKAGLQGFKLNASVDF